MERTNSFLLSQAWIRPVLIGLMLLYWGASKASAADYVVAVDVSGSMSWSLLGKNKRITPQNPVRIEVVRKHLSDYLDSLPDDAHVDLISFNEGIVSERDLTLKDAATREDAGKWVAALHPPRNSHTYLWRTFRKVLQRATTYRAASPDCWVSVRVLTDGENDDPTCSKLTLREVLDEFPEVNGKAMKPDLVLLGSHNLKLIEELRREVGDRANVMNSAFAAAFPPVIKQSIRVSAPNLVADFVTLFDAKEGETIRFVDKSAGEIKSYGWLVDGKAQPSTRDLTQKLSPGNHEVKHVVTDVTGATKEVSKTILLSAISPPPPPPQARFRWSPDDPRAETEIAFTNETTGLLETHNWDFNGEGHSSKTAPRFTFAKPGRKVIRLVVRGPGGESKKEETLIAAGPFKAPAAKIIVSKKSGTVPLDVKFQSEIIGDYSSVNWTFGDGQTSTDPNPAHNFSAAGARVVNLTVIARDPSQVPAVACVAIEAKPLKGFLGANLGAWAVGCALILMPVFALVWWFRKSKPDDDYDDKPMTLGTRRFLIFYLAAICVLTLAAIMVLFSFNFLHDAQEKPIIAAEGLIPKPARYGYLDIKWGHHQRWRLSLDMQFLLLALCAGALGSFIHALRSLTAYLGSRADKKSWFWFYITQPFVGAGLAIIFYAVLRGGLMTGAEGYAAVNPFAVVALGGLVGMFADLAAQKLSDVFKTFFSPKDDPRKDKLASVSPDRLDPPTVPLGGAVRDVTVRGTGLGGTNKVRINGSDCLPKSVSDAAVIFTLTEAQITARGRLTIQLVTTGGDLSRELMLNISDIAISAPPVLHDGAVGQAFAPPVQFEATGGTGAGTYKWNAQGLPKGLTLGEDTGQLAGTPAGGSSGAHPVITVTDRDGATANATFTLRIIQ